MINKLDVYDIFSLFIPGSVLIFGLVFFFPEVCKFLQIEDSLIKFTSFIIFSFILGHLLNAIKSHSAWKLLFEGKDRHPTSHIFERGLGDGTLSVGHAEQIKKKILFYKEEKLKSATADSEAIVVKSDDDCFHYAMQIQADKITEKQLKLYAQYELYRTINVSLVLIGVLFLLKLVVDPYFLSAIRSAFLLSGLFIAFNLFKSMIQTRANYWSREVLFLAEKVIDDSKG